MHGESWGGTKSLPHWVILTPVMPVFYEVIQPSDRLSVNSHTHYVKALRFRDYMQCRLWARFTKRYKGVTKGLLPKVGVRNVPSCLGRPLPALAGVKPWKKVEITCAQTNCEYTVDCIKESAPLF